MVLLATKQYFGRLADNGPGAVSVQLFPCSFLGAASSMQ
jgi:hypothetical protein